MEERQEAEVQEVTEAKKSMKLVITLIVIAVVIAVISFFFLSAIASSADNFTGIYKALDEKRVTVTEFMGATAGSATAISLLPGDAGTPIAEQIADLSGYFLFILTAIMVEKWLVTMSGALAFKIIIPICCILFAIGVAVANNKLKELSIKLVLFSLALFLLVPASVLLTKQIDAASQESIKQISEQAEKDAKEIQDAANDDKDKNALEKFISGVKGGVKSKVKIYEGMLSQFTEYIAALIVTSCVIPIAVILFFFWMIKILTGFEIQLPSFRASGIIRRLK